MRKGILSMEDDSPPIETDEEMPADAPADTPPAEGEDPPAEDAPTDAPTDEPTDAPVDGEPAEGEEEVDLNPDNKPAKLTGLNVDKLAKAELKEEDKKIAKEQERRQEASNEAIPDLELLHSATESFYECMQGKGSPAGFKLAMDVHFRVKHNLGFPPEKRMLSMEDYEVPDRRQVALESIMDTVKTILTAIINAIVRAIDWVKKVFRKYFSETGRLQTSTEKMTDLFLKHRAENDGKLKELEKIDALNHSRYVELITRKLALTYAGKQPGEMKVVDYDWQTGVAARPRYPTYAEAINDLNGVLKMHNALNGIITDGLVSTFVEIENALTNNQALPQTLNVFSPRATTFTGSRKVDHAAGENTPDGSTMYAKDGFLGDFVILTQCANSSVKDPIENAFMQLAKWRCKIVKEQTELKDGWLRNLSTDEVKAAYSSWAAIGGTLVEFEKTTDHIEHVTDSLKNVLIKIKSNIREDVNKETSEVIRKNKLYIEMAAAANSITFSVNALLTGAADHVRSTQIAWLFYLDAIKAYELTLMKRLPV